MGQGFGRGPAFAFLAMKVFMTLGVAAGKGVRVAEFNDSLSVFHFYSDRQMATCRQAI